MKRDANALIKAVACGMFLCCAGMPSYAQQAAPPQSAEHPQYPELPAGPGKDTLVRVCSKCHSPDNVIANGQDRAGWEDTITKMAGFGADGSDDEFTEILDYLEKNFPAVTTDPCEPGHSSATGESDWALDDSRQRLSLTIGRRTATSRPSMISRRFPTSMPKSWTPRRIVWLSSLRCTATAH